jgi:hypothetical protein
MFPSAAKAGTYAARIGTTKVVPSRSLAVSGALHLQAG